MLAGIFTGAAAIRGAFARVHARACRMDMPVQATPDRRDREGAPAMMRVLDVREGGATQSGATVLWAPS